MIVGTRTLFRITPHLLRIVILKINQLYHHDAISEAQSRFDRIRQTGPHTLASHQAINDDVD